jgi:hypothetical protein
VSSKVAEEANVAMRAGEEAESEAGGRERVQPKGRDIDEKKTDHDIVSRTFSFRTNRHRT